MNRAHLALLASAAVLQAGACLANPAMTPWLTRSADNSRSGWNQNEKTLTQAAVAARGIVRSTIIPVAGDARGMEAQPLILPNVHTSRGTRDVMVLPSMADVVRGVDAHDGSAIWQVTLGVPVNGSQGIDFHQINDHWGCLSTGVIDPQLGRLYQVCWVSPDRSGDPTTARWRMFALNVSDGSPAAPSIEIQGRSGTQDFGAAMRKQRSSLVETDVAGVKTVFGCSGTINETQAGVASGFCFAYDVATNAVSAMLSLTAGEGAGVWMAGQGAAADAEGHLYVITGNGDFDGTSQWGESFLKLGYLPPKGGQAAELRVIDHWTPWTDTTRAGGRRPAGTKLAGMSAPSAAVRPVNGSMAAPMTNAKVTASMNERGKPVMLVFPAIASGAWSDEDWGSAGPACIFAIGVCIATGKDGIGYPIRTSGLGGTTVADLDDAKRNCAKLAAPPAWLTMTPGPVDPCPQDPKTLNFFPWGDTAHLHMTPVQFFDPLLRSWTIFAWGENSQLHKWAVAKDGSLSYVAEGNEYASVDARARPPGGMPGGFCSGSSNGADPDSALLVCTIPYGDANATVTNGRLLVYDPVHKASDGSLRLLWDSQRSGDRFIFNKFDPPVIDGGQVYVPNYDGGVDVYRLSN